MNLNQVNNNQEQAATSNVDKAYDPSQTPGAKILLSMQTENEWWNREETLTGDVVKMTIRQATFQGNLMTYDNGKPRWEVVLTIIDKDNLIHLVSFAPKSNLNDALRKALKEYKNLKVVRDILGLNASIECTGKDGKAYTYSAMINGEATHKVEGLFNEDGEEIK